jgi:hypothetical protein
VPSAGSSPRRSTDAAKCAGMDSVACAMVTPVYQIDDIRNAMIAKQHSRRSVSVMACV